MGNLRWLGLACLLFGGSLGTSAIAATVLLVTASNGSLTSEETAIKTQFQNWGYIVTTVWDNDTQANFDTAVSAANAVYIPSTIQEWELTSKLRTAAIGVVCAERYEDVYMGFSTTLGWDYTGTQINVTNNTHDISSGMSTGLVTITNASAALALMNSTIATGLQKLADQNYGNYALGYIDTGGALANTTNGNSTATARRVRLCWGGDSFSISSLNATGLTILHNSLDWAIGNKRLIAHWKLNETSGTSAADSSGLNYTGTVTGTASWVAAARNNGFAFNGSTKIQATGLLGNPKNISAAAWANLTTVDASGSEIISLGDHFNLRIESGQLKAVMYNGSSWLTVTYSGTYANTGWHHFATTFDDDNNLFKLYVDGVQVASTSNTSSINYTGLSSNTVIGRHGGGSTAYDFTGTLDDVRVYNYALTAKEVAELYGFVGQWKLADGSGTTAADSTVFAQNGTVNGGASWTTRCNGDGAFDFNGSTHYISVANASQLKPTEAITITAWVKGDAWGTGTDIDTIVRKGETEPNNYQLSITGGKVALNLDTSDGSGINGSTTLSTGQWYHVAATWDGTTGNVYVNGVLDGSAAKSGTLNTDTRPLYIGGRSGADLFDGALYDVRLYNRALSATEIAKLAGLVGLWAFSEGTGTTAADTSGLGNNATLSGATWTTDCAGYTALQTNGTGGIAATTSAFTPPDEGTVSFWMKSSGSPGAAARLFGVGADWEVRQSTDGTLSFDLCGDATPDVISTIPLNEVGRWYHVVETFKSSNDTYAIYIDGQLNKSGTNQVAMVQQPSAVLSFGTRTGTTDYWQGALRDFRIYSRKLCPAEIAELYGLVGYWALDESSGTSAADSSGEGRNGTVSGTATWSTGKINNGFSLNGSSSISVTGQMGRPRNVTLAAWAKLTSPDSAGAEVISLGDTIAIRLDSGTTTLTYFYNGTTWTNVAFSQTYAGTGWHHYAAVFDDDHDYCRIYVDGVQKANVSTTSSLAYTLGTSTTIGKHGNGGNAYDFNGLIDDVRIYNRPLCATEVQRLYSSGGSPGVRIIKWVEIQ